MSMYNDLIQKVARGSKYNINLVQKTLSIDRSTVVLEGNLIDENDVGNVNPWDILETLYSSYKRSVPSAHHNKNKPYFKAVSAEELSDDELAFNEPRILAQFKLELFVLLGGLSGMLKIENDKHWFWQGNDKELICLREWVN